MNRSYAHSSLGFTGNVTLTKASEEYNVSNSNTLQPIKAKALNYKTNFPKFVNGKARSSMHFVSFDIKFMIPDLCFISNSIFS